MITALRKSPLSAESIWPDWEGDSVAIIASGPSAKSASVGDLKGRIRVLAIKRNIELAPFADAVYGCDGPWWRSVRGLPDFGGLKMCWDEGACNEFGLQRVRIEPKLDRMVFDQIGAVGAGGNSGFQAVNLAAQFGAKRILLVGFDMHGRGGEHWYGRNNWMMANNPDETNYRRWRASFAASAPDLADRGVEVVNASPFSELKSFRRAGIAETLEAWGL